MKAILKQILSKYFLVSLFFLFLFSCSNTNFIENIVSNFIKKEISSPDNSLTLNVNSKNGKISYSLMKNNKLIIEESALGMITDKFDFFNNLSIHKMQISNNNQSWTQVWGEQKVIFDNHNELALSIISDDSGL